MSAPAARRTGSWRSSTTNSLARTGTSTAPRTARRSVHGTAEPVRLAQDRDGGARRRPRRRAPARPDRRPRRWPRPTASGA